MSAIEQLLERVLGLDGCDEDARSIFRAFLDGDRSTELLGRAVVRYLDRAGETSASAAPIDLAVGWTVLAVRYDLANDPARRDGAIRSAAWALDSISVDDDRPTLESLPSEDTDPTMDLDWDLDACVQPEVSP